MGAGLNLAGLIDVVADGIAKIAINRPKAMHALNGATVTEPGDAFGRTKEDKAVRVVILTGSGEKAFIAGADINEIKGTLGKSPVVAREEFALRGRNL